MPRDLRSEILRLIRPLQMRLANSIARAVVQLVDDTTKIQLLQLGVLADEDVDDAERVGQYGLLSIPHVGAEAVVVFPNGDRAHPLVVAVDDRRYRPTGGEAGEVGLYTDEGDEIRLARGQVVIVKAGTEIRLGSATASRPVALAEDLEELRAAIAGAATGDAVPGAVTALGPYTGASKVKVD